MDVSTKKTGNLFLISGIVIAILFYPVVGHLVFAGRGYSGITVISSRLLIWAEILLLYFHARWVEGNGLILWPEVKYKAGFYFASLGALYLLGIGASLVSKIPLLFGAHDDRKLLLRMMGLVAQSWPLLVFTALTAGVTEELIFRGYILPRLELLFKNKYMPVIVPSLAFGLLHFRYGNFVEVIFATLFGVVFAIHYQWYRNIKILMFTHAFVDFVSLCIFKAAMYYHLPVK